MVTHPGLLTNFQRRCPAEDDYSQGEGRQGPATAQCRDERTPAYYRPRPKPAWLHGNQRSGEAGRPTACYLETEERFVQFFGMLYQIIPDSVSDVQCGNYTTFPSSTDKYWYA